MTTTFKPRKRLLKPKKNVAERKRARSEENGSSRNIEICAATKKPPCSTSYRNRYSLILEESERLFIFRTCRLYPATFFINSIRTTAEIHS